MLSGDNVPNGSHKKTTDCAIGDVAALKSTVIEGVKFPFR